MSSLLEKATLIYDYMQEKPFLKTYMTYKPMKVLCEKHVIGLGFKVTESTKRDCKILLNKKDEDLKVKLILAHYSMSLMPLFMMEGCLSIYL